MSTYICQSVVSSLKAKCEAFMVDAEEMKKCRVEVMHRDGIFGDVVAVVVCLAVGASWPNAASCEPDGKAARMVIPTVVAGAQVALAIDGASELTAPDDQGVV